MDLLATLPLGNLSAGALLAVVIILIVRGDLVPRKIHEEVRQDRERLRDTNAVLVETNRLLAENTSLGVHALQAIEQQALSNVRGTPKDGAT